MLRIGQTVTGELSQTRYVVKQQLGEGGQGTVYLVEGPDRRYALKWYNVEQATSEQREAIRKLVTEYQPPGGVAGRRFVWPIDLVTVDGSERFGYLMDLIDTERFTDLAAVWARRRRPPARDILCEISCQLVQSYRALHLAGYCYRDISRSNVLFDPLQGDVLICDNDNVGINRQSTCQIWGTIEYMAPELIRGDERHPSTDTDLHSLAVLLFQLWIWHHPLQGDREYRVRCWDLQAKRLLYGVQPVFVFHPNDPSNRLPRDPEYQTAHRLWEICPPGLRELFTRAFTHGLADPRQRVTEGEWLLAFRQLRDATVRCPACRAVSVCDTRLQEISCWNCRQTVPLPPRLRFHHATGPHVVFVNAETKLLRRHLGNSNDDDGVNDVIGEVTQNPMQPGSWGIRNLSQATWVATSVDGKNVEVPPGKAVKLVARLRLQLLGATAELIS
ncbi:MAG: hypothetical protein RMJ82_15160 [Gemmatales bacterium]|nr:hypothetical protein [Gemmatales bacterium]